jgi:hypothetical protein
MEWPGLYPRHLHKTQRAVLDRFPFSIVYRELLDEIQIIAMAHAKRRPGYWAKRLQTCRSGRGQQERIDLERIADGGRLRCRAVDVSPAANAGGRSESGGPAKTWTLANDRVARTVGFHPGKGLLTERLSDLATGADFIALTTKDAWMQEEFFFTCNGRCCAGAGADFDLLDAREAAIAGGKLLTVRLRHTSLALEVAVVYRIYDGHAATRKRLALRNTGAGPLRIFHLCIEALGVSLGPGNELTLLTQYGTIPREIFYTGRSEVAGLLAANGRTGTGIAVVSDVPGYMKRTEIAGWDDPDHVRIGVLYDTDLMPLERALAPGEEFTTASASLVLFRNGDGFNDPHWALPFYAAKVLERRDGTP